MFHGADFPRLGNAIVADCCRLTWSQGNQHGGGFIRLVFPLSARCYSPVVSGKVWLKHLLALHLLEFLTWCRSPVCWGLEGVQATEHALSEIYGLE